MSSEESEDAYNQGFEDAMLEMGRYSHRNGEFEHPTEQGYYWIHVRSRETVVVDYYRGNGSWEFAYGDQGDQFWGPMTPPEGLKT